MFKKIYIPVFAVFLFLLPSVLHAQIRVNRITEGFNAGDRNGIIYALPRTIIRVDVTIEHKEYLAGPLRDYANKYLGISSYIDSDSHEYSLKDVSILPSSEPDPEHYYFVSRGEKAAREAWKTILKLNGEGMITSLTATDAEQAGQARAIGRKAGEDEIFELFSKYADLNLYARVDTIVRTINIDTISIEDYTFRTTMAEKPMDIRAREVADMIQRIREGRYNLLTGFQEVNYSEGALKFMNDELLRMEEEYMRLFTGATLEKELTYSFSFLPTPDSDGDDIALFSLSAEQGMSSDWAGGTKGYIRVESHGNTNAFSRAGANEGGGLVYRIPEKAVVKLIYENKVIARINTFISQYGRVASLPPDASDVEFDGTTGGLKSLKLEAE